jgi:sulfatase maturation enzyme AslB (radical SAM superfamily)
MSEPRYCSLLWKHISNEPQGYVRTCCIARDRVTRPDGTEYTLGDASVREIFNSEYYKNIREQIRQGELPQNCNICWQDESNGKKSKRQIYNDYAQVRYGDIDWAADPEMPQDLQLILSSTCNLKCRSCNPLYSSKWVAEAEKRGLPYRFESVNIPMNDQQRSKFWLEMQDWIPHVKFLEIMGGEPLYMKEFRQFANLLIDSGYSRNISLQFSTNGTNLNKQFMENLIDNFNGIGFGVSIDAAQKDRFEYIRHGANWEKVSSNLDYFHKLHTDQKTHVGITCTVTAMNVMYLAEFTSIFAQRWPNFEIYFNLAHYPSWFNPNVFEESVKEQIVAPLLAANYASESIRSQIAGIINHVMTPLADLVPEGPTKSFEIARRRSMFQQQIAAGDVYRNENFATAFPELWDIISIYYDYYMHRQIAMENPRYGAIPKGDFI